VSAVTGACLLVGKEQFWEVGGLDESGFAVAFNDVDLCMKLQAAGYHNIYEPRATLIHHESKSRARDTHPTQIERYRRELALLQERWGGILYRSAAPSRAGPDIETYRIAL
jgi:GT2 family glycosyltransferase